MPREKIRKSQSIDQPPNHSKRPDNWEDDFSRNTLDTEAFENGAPITSYSDSRILTIAKQFDRQVVPSVGTDILTEKDPYPIPSKQDREGYLPNCDIRFWLSGVVDYLKVISSVRDLGIRVDSMLEFGGASGRVVRHFCCQSDIREIWCSDINFRHIRWLSQFMPANLKPIHNCVMPGLPIADHSLDLICAFSVFTHIDTFESAWLAEMSRMLRPGGICYFTIHNDETWRSLRELGSENRLVKSLNRSSNFSPAMLDTELQEDRMVFRFTDIGPYRSQVFHSNDFIKRVWGRFFEIESILPQHHGRQAVVVMRKPGVSQASFAAA